MIRHLRDRLREESGFTMLLALGVMMVTSLLTGALFLAVDSDVGLTKADLDGKRAYAAAQAGAQAYLFNLNHNSAASKWWQTCTNDSGTNVAVPGNTAESYSYAPVVSGCATTGAIGTVLDPNTGQLRMKFTGTSGTATRTLVVAFRTLTPLSYLWYTDYETTDPVIGGPDCDRYYWQNPGPPSSCQIQWATGDSVKGPMYTQDEFLMGGTPIFGRTKADAIASSAPEPHVCVAPSGGGVVQEACPTPTLVGTEDANAQLVPLPADNSNLQTDAQANGIVLTGTTTLTIDGGSAKAVSCQTVTSCTTVGTINLTLTPIIYVKNGALGCPGAYTPANVPTPVTVPASPPGQPSNPNTGDYVGSCGDVYVTEQSPYSTSLTIAAENDIIVQGNLTSSTAPTGGMPTGSATLGLVADDYVRIWHPQDANGNCANPDVTIDAAILTLAHSFFVDNYDCGPQSGTKGTLTVNGAIAQKFRGIVAIANSNEGYFKNYNYDDRFAYLMPPYMFDLQEASWEVVRETLCGNVLPATNPASCQYTG